MNKPRNHHPDLDALLRNVPVEEAARLRQVWDLVGDEEPVDVPRAQVTEDALRRFQSTVASGDAGEGKPRLQNPRLQNPRPQYAPDRPTRRTSRVRQRRAWWRGQTAGGTAALLVALLVGVLGVLGVVGVFWWQRPVTQTAPLGERLALTLPDGSSVELNSGSSIRYERRFGATRVVYVEGEAFFEVARDTRPFVVHTFNADVTVHGTRFNVRAWPSDLDRSTIVTLEEGRLTVAPTGHPDRAVVLAPGESRRVAADLASGDPLERLDVSVSDVTAWRRGDLVFKDQPLGVILREVERRFAVNLQLQPRSLQHERTNLALRQPANAETVIRDLSVALGLRYRATSTGYELYGDGPPENSPGQSI